MNSQRQTRAEPYPQKKIGEGENLSPRHGCPLSKGGTVLARGIYEKTVEGVQLKKMTHLNEKRQWRKNHGIKVM